MMKARRRVVIAEAPVMLAAMTAFLELPDEQVWQLVHYKSPAK